MSTMLRIVFTPSFLRQCAALPQALQEEVKEKILVFQKDPRHSSLRTHKLKGALKGYWSFRVNYAYRIVFEYDSKNTVALLKVGDHDVYA